MKNLLLHIAIVLLTTVNVGKSQIVAGPMLGYNTLREASIWIETARPQEVTLRYWRIDAPEYDVAIRMESDNDHGRTITFVAGLLEPGTTYQYAFEIDDITLSNDDFRFTTQTLWNFRTPPPDFTFLTGSCMFINEPEYDRPGKGYGGEYEILTSMALEDAEFMMWLGDNTYLREVDYDSKSGIYHRYSHTRRTEELQPLLRKMFHYAIWDDHDYGPNDSDHTYPLKSITKAAFEDYWPMPTRDLPGQNGITNAFIYNDCVYLLMDNRWNRSPQAPDGHILGEDQVQWMIDLLRYSKANFKFVCIGGQFLSDAAIYENHAVYAEERQRIIDAIDKHQIKNVIFLSGDRHSSEVTKMTTKGGIDIYDITSSPITSTAYDHSKEPNSYRVPGSGIDRRSYATISVSGPFKSRSLELTFKDMAGKALFNYTIDTQGK